MKRKYHILIFGLAYFIIGCNGDTPKDATQDKAITNTDTTIIDPKISIPDPFVVFQDSLNKELLRANEENDLLEKQVEKLNGKIGNLNEENNSLVQQVSTLNGEIGSLEKEIINKSQKLNHIQRSLDDANRQVESGFRSFEIPLGKKYNQFNKILILVIILSIVILVATLSAFYLYRWRRILSNKDGREILKPEEFVTVMGKITKQITNNDQSLQLLTQNIQHQGVSHDDKITNMTETFMTMQKTLTQQEEEIKRLKKGYDSEIYKKFLSRFIHVDQLVNQNIDNKNIDSKTFERIKNRLEDALAECQVELFTPEIGKNYRDFKEKDLDISFENTKDKSKAWEIFEIIEGGYKLSIPDNKYEVIIPAKVKVYREMEKK